MIEKDEALCWSRELPEMTTLHENASLIMLATAEGYHKET